MGRLNGWVSIYGNGQEGKMVMYTGVEDREDEYGLLTNGYEGYRREGRLLMMGIVKKTGMVIEFGRINQTDFSNMTLNLHHTVNTGHKHHKDSTSKLLGHNRSFTMLNLTQSHDDQLSERDFEGDHDKNHFGKGDDEQELDHVLVNER